MGTAPTRPPRPPVSAAAALVDSGQAALVAGYAVHSEEPLAVVSALDAGPTLTWVNDAFSTLFGYGCDDVVGQPLGVLTTGPFRSSDESPHAVASIELRGSRAVSSEVLAVRADGSRFTATVRSVPSDSQPGSWVVSVRAAEPDTAGADLRASEHRFRALAERSPIATFFSESGLRLGYVNDRFATLFGAPVESLLGTGWMDVVDETARGALTDAFVQTLSGHPAEVPITLPDEGAGVRWMLVRAEPVTTPSRGAGFVGTVEDVTERRAFEGRLAYQAMHDQLTGLPNRAHLWATIAGILDGTDDDDRDRLALLFLDLDNFKIVNDSLGHDAGDRLLVETATRLRRTMRDDDLVARFGGDEFVVVCRNVRNDTHASLLADRVLSVVSRPVLVSGMTIHPSTSIGIVRAESRHTSAVELVSDADIAMYEAKRSGKNRHAILDRGARAAMSDRLNLLNDLRGAIDDGSLEVHYQPVVSLPEGRPVGLEALARWNHPERGPVAPDVFIPLAEEGGLIRNLGRLVLGRACADIAALRSRGGADALLNVAVNVSADQLPDETLVPFVAGLLEGLGLPGDALCIEVTESVLMSDAGAAAETLRRLRELGITVAVDDFGTGYSCLAYLRHLPVDFLKLDRAFVSELDDDGAAPGALAVAEAVAALASGLGLRSVAEGVESLEQARLLASAGCDFAQGWLYARAMPVLELSDWLTTTPVVAASSTAGAPEGTTLR